MFCSVPQHQNELHSSPPRAAQCATLQFVPSAMLALDFHSLPLAFCIQEGMHPTQSPPPATLPATQPLATPPPLPPEHTTSLR